MKQGACMIDLFIDKNKAKELTLQDEVPNTEGEKVEGEYLKKIEISDANDNNIKKLCEGDEKEN